jgi:hypothetical protein
MSKVYNIPTWSPDKQWHYTKFSTKESFRDFVKGLFKEPGQYKFDETVKLFNKHARFFNKNKLYTIAPEGSRDWIEYWDTEKEKCRKGVIFHNDKGDTWYLPRFYYHWLNFLQIGGKEEGAGFQFPYIWDTQYHISLYEILAELHGMNSVILKKRQIASSYIHACKLYNKYIFEDGYVAKMLASKSIYIDGTNGTWKMLNEYHNFNNKYTAWACSNNPEMVGQWQQKVEQKTADGRKVTIGTGATIVGITLDKNPVGGVGGRVHEVFYEEGGVAPTADTTYVYMKPALKQGAVATGVFSIAGSVGELDQCGPLKKFLISPISYEFYGVHTNLIDENGTEGIRGLFIPEQWSYPPFIDEYGNSLVEEALAHINQYYEDCRVGNKAKGIEPKTAEDYQTLVSQGPRNIKEAFAIRTQSIFPVKFTTRQVKNIEDGKVYLRNVDLERTPEGTITWKKAEREPMQYPSSMKLEDKRGCVVIHQHPGPNPEWMTYFWSADPVETGDTKTSESLAAIYIYMNLIEVTRIDAEGNSKTFIEGDKLVAEWVGRYDDVNETNEQMSLLIEYYNAWGVSERNKPSLNTYMILKKRQRHLAPSTEMLFDSESSTNEGKYFGWVNTTGTWNKIIQYGVDSLPEVLEEGRTEEDGTIVPTRYGVERIPFIWLLKEMQEYQKGKNADRVIAFCALMAFAKLQQAKQRSLKRTDRSEQKPTDSRTFTCQSFLKSVGQQSLYGPTIPKGMTLKTVGRGQKITNKR